MKIAFDCSLVPGERGGIGQYSYNLAHGLSSVDKINTYKLYILFPAASRLLHPERLKTDLPDSGNFSVVYKTIPVPFQLFHYFWIPGMPSSFREYMLGDLDVDIIHSNTFSVPRLKNRKKKLVVTIYDLTVVTHPEHHKKTNISHCVTGIKDAVKYADHIIAISNHTKRDLIEHFNAPEELITVTHLAAGPDYREEKDPERLAAIRMKYGLPEDYVLFIGSLEPRKNVKTLIKAYSALDPKTRKEHPLVIAGGKGWLNSDIPSIVKKSGISDNVLFAGYISSEDISGVYSQAALFVYPSLYEGFGLPILEAFACGTPVITSNTSSIPEVAGDAAMLLSPADADQLTAAIERLLKNKGIRDEFRARGLARASMFSWEKCARETLEVYNKVMRA